MTQKDSSFAVGRKRNLESFNFAVIFNGIPKTIVAFTNCLFTMFEVT